MIEQILKVGKWLNCTKCNHPKIIHKKANGIYFCDDCECMYEVKRRIAAAPLVLYQMEVA